MKKVFNLFILVAVFVALASGTMWAQITLHVDDDGVQWPGAYTTISVALTVAFSGDTIIVHAGTYAESVSITTDNLTLETDGAVIVDPPDAANKSCFKVRADGVTIRGFELTGANGNGSFGIDFEGSSNTFTDNVIHDLAGSDTGGGIVSWDYDGGTDDNTISDNTIYNITANGILIGACTPSAVNTGNTIRNNTISSCGTWHPGIEVVNGNEFDILENSVSGYTGWPQYYGISVLAWNGVAQGGHNISRNEVEGYYYGILLMADTGESGFGGVIHGFLLPSSVSLNNNLVTRNDVHDNLYHGIVLLPDATSVPATVSGNSLSHNDSNENDLYYGIYVGAGADSNNVHHNTANGNGSFGIQISGDNNKIHHNTATTVRDSGTGNKWFNNK